jgi:hypothetical protein
MPSDLHEVVLTYTILYWIVGLAALFCDTFMVVKSYLAQAKGLDQSNFPVILENRFVKPLLFLLYLVLLFESFLLAIIEGRVVSEEEPEPIKEGSTL